MALTTSVQQWMIKPRIFIQDQPDGEAAGEARKGKS